MTARVISLALFIGLCLAIGALGGWATATSVKTWYPTLSKPFFTPPDAVFGPVWTILYVLMGIAAWRVREFGAGPTGKALALFGVQLALNLLWSVVFFGLQKIGAAVLVIVLLEAAIVATIALFHRLDRIAALLMLPYALWVAFATALNVAIWRLN